METVVADLLDPAAVAALPDAPNVVFMAGRKFGSSGGESLTWAMNSYVPALVAARYGGARVTVFSSGNVYPLLPVTSGGATEETPPQPVGEYAQSVLARERLFEHFSAAERAGRRSSCASTTPSTCATASWWTWPSRCWPARRWTSPWGTST